MPGRLRRWRHGLLLVPLFAGGWAWFGWLGLVPLLVWWWHVRPRPQRGHWEIAVDDLRVARFGHWRVLLAFHGQRRLEIFSDELTPADLARLRRDVKAWLAGRAVSPQRA